VTDSGNKIVGLDPTAPPTVTAERGAARRAGSLDGAVVGLISNQKGRATPLLLGIYEEMGRLVDLEDRVVIEKAAVYAVPDPDEWARLTAQATVGVTAFGG
jgi:hypothetical protein